MRTYKVVSSQNYYSNKENALLCMHMVLTYSIPKVICFASNVCIMNQTVYNYYQVASTALP